VDKDNTNEKFPVWRVLLLLAVIVAVWITAWWGIPQLYPKRDEAGQFGDMFGAVNALFSGMALAGVVVAIWLQSRELALQRKELRSQKEQLQRQGDTSHLQRLETTFFQLLRRQSEVLEAMVHPGNLTIRGRECMKKFVEGLSRNYQNRARAVAQHDEQWRRAESFRELWNGARQALGPFMETLGVIAQLVSRTDLRSNEFLCDALVAQLSDEELGLFLVYSQTEIATDQLRSAVDALGLWSSWRARRVPDEVTRNLRPFLGCSR